MATITWTGASSSSFFSTANWDLGLVPGTGDVAVVGLDATPNILALGANATIAGLQLNGAMGISAGTLTVNGHASVGDNSLSLTGTGKASFGSLDVTAGGGVGIGAGTELTVSGHTYVSEGLSIAGDGTNDPDLNGTASFSTLQIEAGASVTNAGVLAINNASDRIDSFGVLQNTGHANLVAGALNGGINNQGQIHVQGDFSALEYLSDNDASLMVQGVFETMRNSQFQGAITVVLDADPAANGRIFVNGMISIGLQSLVIDATAGALSEGSSHTIFTSGITAMDAFTVADYAVTGQHADFAYALGLTGVDTAVGSLNLYALNDGATGGRAVLEDSATSRDITVAINSDTGRGTIFGGSFADLHASLLHGVDEVRSGSGDDVLAVDGGTAGFTLVGNLGADRMTGGDGADALSGGGDADTIKGGGGADTLRGGAGDDLFFASSSDTIIETASGGSDTVRSAGAFVLGTNLEHLILTGAGTSNGTGNALNNRLTGNDSANRLDGSSGADKLKGNAGDDTLTGGTGADDFVFVSGSGLDRITDFNATGSNADDIDFRGHSQILSFADLKANHMRAVGSNVEIKAGPDVLTLVNVRLADLDASDFIF